MLYITNVIVDNDEYVIFGYEEDGTKKIIREPYEFDLFFKSDKGKFEDIFGNKYNKLTYTDIKTKREIIKKFQDTHKSQREFIYSPCVNSLFGGDVSDANHYIFNYFQEQNLIVNDDKIQEYIYQTNKRWRKFFIDIEFYGDSDIDDLEASKGVINIVTIIDSKTKNVLTYGLKNDYKPKKLILDKMEEWKLNKILYKKFNTEKELLQAVARTFSELAPDVVTGWFSNGYDIPMILLQAQKNGIKLNDFSPIRKHTFIKSRIWNGKKKYSFGVGGIHFIDYQVIYKKFRLENLTSFSLNNVSKVELNDEKLKFNSGVSKELINSFNEFAEKDWENFTNYNIKDTVLVYLLDEKFDYLNKSLGITMSGCGLITDVTSPIRIWDNLNYTEFRRKNRIVNGAIGSEEMFSIQQLDYSAGYVKTILEGLKPGLKRRLVSFDLNSEYPTINISLDMSYENQLTIDIIKENHKEVYTYYIDYIKPLTEKEFWSDYFEEKGIISEFQELLKENNLIFTINGVFWKKTPGKKLGFVSSIYKKYYDRRVKTKSQLEELSPNDIIMKEILDGLQYQLKNALNAGTGIHASKYYRYFNVDFIESITTTGRMLINYTGYHIAKFLFKHFEKEYRKYGYTKDTFNDICVYNDTDSVGKDSIIVVNGKDIKIEDYYNNAKEIELIERGKDNYIKKLDGKDKSPSINNSGLQLEENSIKYIMKHKVKKRMYKIKVKNKEVIVTEDHSVMVLRNGKLIGIKVKNIQKKDKIIVKNYLMKNNNYEIVEDFEIEDLGIVEDYVYDIEIEHNHNFFANDILVHNSCFFDLEPNFYLNILKKSTENMDIQKTHLTIYAFIMTQIPVFLI